MGEYKMSHSGAQLDEAISKVLGGYVLPSEIINIVSNVSDMDITNGKTLNVNVPPSIPSGYIKPTGNLTDSLITRGSNLTGHAATIPAGYYVNSAFTITEWQSGTLTGNGASGGQFTIPYSSIGFIPTLAVIMLDSSSFASNIVWAHYSWTYGTRCIWMKNGITATANASQYAAMNSNGVTFTAPSGAKYHSTTYRWFAMR